MNTIDIRITDKQLEYLKRKAGRRSVTNQLTDMVMQMIDAEIKKEQEDDKSISN